MANFYDFLIFTQCQNEMKFVKLIERYELMKIFNGGVFTFAFEICRNVLLCYICCCSIWCLSDVNLRELKSSDEQILSDFLVEVSHNFLTDYHYSSN